MVHRSSTRALILCCPARRCRVQHAWAWWWCDQSRVARTSSPSARLRPGELVSEAPRSLERPAHEARGVAGQGLRRVRCRFAGSVDPARCMRGLRSGPGWRRSARAGGGEGQVPPRRVRSHPVDTDCAPRAVTPCAAGCRCGVRSGLTATRRGGRGRGDGRGVAAGRLVTSVEPVIACSGARGAPVPLRHNFRRSCAANHQLPGAVGLVVRAGSTCRCHQAAADPVLWTGAVASWAAMRSRSRSRSVRVNFQSNGVAVAL